MQKRTNEKIADDDVSFFNATEKFLQSINVDPQQKQLFQLAFSEFQQNQNNQLKNANSHCYLSWFYLPRLGYVVSGKSTDPSFIALTVSTCLLHAGLNLLDSWMDNELSEKWQSIPSNLVLMTAYHFINELSNEAIIRIPATEHVRLMLLNKKNLYQLKIFSGQKKDIALREKPTWELDDYLACINQKSGEVAALYFSLGNTLVGFSGTKADTLETMLAQLTCISQIQNDNQSLFIDDWSMDLANGTYTLPVITYFNNLSTIEKPEFLKLLSKARHSKKAQQQVRLALRKSSMPALMYAWISFSYNQIYQQIIELDLNETAKKMLQDIFPIGFKNYTDLKSFT